MRTEAEAVHFLKSAQLATQKACVIRLAPTPGGPRRYRIFPDEEVYQDYLRRVGGEGGKSQILNPKS
ncbi:MAG: hypothetical protein HY671_01290 [Chloroflexi bacterium]|nr:hypothetical protein [Chloroflexota bacterium]